MKGKISTEGFRSNSPDRNNDYNVIPSNIISMSQVDFPILGIDNLGNKKFMMPGNSSYKFKGSHVLELPMKQMGGDISGLSPEDARQALLDGHIMGNPLTPEQRTFFAEVAGTDEEGNLLDEESEGGEEGGIMKKGGNWIKDAVNPEHKGYCTPMTKSTCTPHRKAFAMTMKKHHGFHQMGGEEVGDYQNNFNNPFFQIGGQPTINSINNPNQVLTTEDKYAKDFTLGRGVNKPIYDATQQMAYQLQQHPNKYVAVGFGVGGPQYYTDTTTGKTVPASQVQQERAQAAIPAPPSIAAAPNHFNEGGEPCFECGGANMRDGGAFLKTLIKSAYKDVMKKGGQSSPQGMTGDDVLAERKSIFRNYLSNNAMYALAMEEHANMMNPKPMSQYGGMLQMGGPSDIAFQPANNSEAFWGNLPGYSTQVDGITGNSGTTTNPMPTFGSNYNYTGNVSPKLDQTNQVVGAKNSQASGMMLDFQKASSDRNPLRNPQQPTQKQPTWLQKNGQTAANGIIAGLNFGASFLDAQNTNANNKLLKQRTDADSVFQPNNAGSANRGDYDTNSGVYKPNQYVPVQNRGNMKFGGEHEEQYLSDAEIKKLKEQGHKIIYLD